MARVSHEYRIASGEPDDQLCAQLADFSSHGWDVIGVTHGSEGLICLLRRERDFEVARSLMTVLEEQVDVDAISRHAVPPEELGS